MDFCPKKKAGYISMGRVHGALRRPALAALQQQAAEPELSASQPLTTRTRAHGPSLSLSLALSLSPHSNEASEVAKRRRAP